MEDTVSFEHMIVMSFTDLQSNLQDRIFSKLSEQEFFNVPYEIINITSFDVKEMLVSGTAVVCKINIQALVNYPRPGIELTLTDYQIKGNSMVYIHKPSCRIIINAKVSEKQRQEHIRVRIVDCKKMAKNILCVAEII